MFNLDSLLRDNIRKIKPYSSARDEYTGTASVFLDANENAYGSIGTENRHRYPDPYQSDLKRALSSHLGVDAGQIFLGNGSDEAIDLVFRIFCEPRIDAVLAMPPTYGMYRVGADINDVDVVEIPLLDGFKIDVDNVLRAVQAPGNNIKAIFICSPNNPSANTIDAKDIQSIVEQFKGIVVIDEAYADFSEHESWVSKINTYPNLIILQTFSKAWGLANIRLGIAIAQRDIISVFSKVKPPYNVNGVTQELAIEALKNKPYKEELVRQIIQERKMLVEKLKEKKMILEVFPSDANFILIKTTHPDKLYDYLIDKQIVVRNRSKMHLCEGCLRITVGTSEENKLLLSALDSFTN